jgi:hypothetical protein
LIAAAWVAFQLLVALGGEVADTVDDGLDVAGLTAVEGVTVVAAPGVHPVSRASAIMQPVRGSRRGSVIGAPFFSLAH